jgi:hypothetical protein
MPFGTLECKDHLAAIESISIPKTQFWASYRQNSSSPPAFIAGCGKIYRFKTGGIYPE